MLKITIGTLTGFQGENKLDSKYRASVTLEQTPHFLIEGMVNGKWYLRGSWYVHTIMQSTEDVLYIDFGQDWYVTGMSRIRQSFEEVE